MKTIIIATNNKEKIREFKEMLPNYKIRSLNELDFKDEIIEDGQTFAENAIIKAKAISKYLKEKNEIVDVIAEDSGICCDGLDGKPGIYSARYAGDHNDQLNRNKIRDELRSKENKKAHYNSTIVLYHPDDTYEVFTGETYGIIIAEEKGYNGFGYDPIFYSTEINKTFGEATKEEKNSVSHRRRALDKLMKKLN